MSALFLRKVAWGLGVPTLIAMLFVFGNLGVPVAESQMALLTPTPLTTAIPPRPPSQQPQVPTISFVDNPSATCYRPAAGTGTCYLTWSYLSVSASSGQYIISMTVTIDGSIRAYHAGFFQTSMYVPGTMYGNGFQVTCGVSGASGVPMFGKSYNYTVRALETGGLSAANYGAVVCPADQSTTFMPLIFKP